MENYISEKTKKLQEKLLESQKKDQVLERQLFEELGKIEIEIQKVENKKISPDEVLNNKKEQLKNLKAEKNKNNSDADSKLNSNDLDKYSEPESQNQEP